MEGDGGHFLRLNKGVEREKAIPKIDEGVKGEGGHMRVAPSFRLYLQIFLVLQRPHVFFPKQM